MTLSRVHQAAILAGALALTIKEWLDFWYLTDDAFITVRDKSAFSPVTGARVRPELVLVPAR